MREHRIKSYLPCSLSVATSFALLTSCTPWGVPLDGDTNSGSGTASGTATAGTTAEPTSASAPTSGVPSTGSGGESTGGVNSTTMASSGDTTAGLDQTTGTTDGVDQTTGTTADTTQASTSDTTTGESPCGLQWQKPFIYGLDGIALELTSATRNPAGDLILVGKQGASDSFVIKLDSLTGEKVWEKTLSGTLTDTAANMNGIYVSGFKPGIQDPDSFLARFDENGNMLSLQGGGVPSPSNDKAYALTLTTNGRVAVTGYCGTAKQLLIGLRDSMLAGSSFECSPNNPLASDLRGWDVVEFAGGFLVGGQWSDTLDLPPMQLPSAVPTQANFLAFLDKNGVPTKSIALPMFGSTRVNPAANSSLPAVVLDTDAASNIFVAGRKKTGACTTDCLPVVAKFDANGGPLGSPVELSTDGGVPTSIEIDVNGNVFVTGATGVTKFDGEGVSRSGRAFASQLDTNLTTMKNWAMSEQGPSGVESVLIDSNNGIVFWAGNVTSQTPLVWADDDNDPSDDPLLEPMTLMSANIFVAAQCME